MYYKSILDGKVHDYVMFVKTVNNNYQMVGEFEIVTSKHYEEAVQEITEFLGKENIKEIFAYSINGVKTIKACQLKLSINN